MKMLRKLICFIAMLAFVFTAGNVFAQGQPNVNLGFTSFLDGGPPAGPGHYVSEYLQFYSADKLNDENGNKSLDARVNVWVLMNQYIYQSDQELFAGGKWGLNVMLPIVSLDAQFPLSDNGYGVGDLLVGPYLQWDPIMGKKGPLMLNRIELQTILPTGKNNINKNLNQGSNHYSFNPYWAATVFLGPKVTASWRLHYLWNGTNDTAGVNLKPGQAVHGNFAAAYEVLPKQLRIGLNGYFFQQFSGTKVGGANVPGMKESVFAIGPGAIWHLSKDSHLFFNAYVESEAESRPEGERYTLRFVQHF